jgi:membrane protease YdiL (CAAX protease family)
MSQMAPLLSEPVPDTRDARGERGREPFRYYAWLIPAWVGAWLLYEGAALEALPSAARIGYWTIAKLIIWIAPVLLIVRYSLRRPVAEYLGLVRPIAGVRTGLVVGAVFVLLSASIDSFTRTYRWPAPSLGLLSALTVAPLFEEVMFRGFALRALQDSGYRFWPANAIASLMFLGLHLPGWYFMNAFSAPQLVVGASVLLIGMVAGYAKRRADSTWASVAFHFVNNLYSAFLH